MEVGWRAGFNARLGLVATLGWVTDGRKEERRKKRSQKLIH